MMGGRSLGSVAEEAVWSELNHHGRVLHNTDTMELAGFIWPDVKHGYRPFGSSKSHLMLGFTQLLTVILMAPRSLGFEIRGKTQPLVLQPNWYRGRHYGNVSLDHFLYPMSTFY